MIYTIITLLAVLCITFIVLYVLKCKKLNKVWSDRDSMAWKYMRLMREFNLLTNSIVTIEDELPKKVTTVSIGMKLSNEMAKYVDVDEEHNMLRARMILPNYSLEDYIKEYSDDEIEVVPENKEEK